MFCRNLSLRDNQIRGAMELLTNGKRNVAESSVYCEPELHVESNS
jgi:hypothetical protein